MIKALELPQFSRAHRHLLNLCLQDTRGLHLPLFNRTAVVACAPLSVSTLSALTLVFEYRGNAFEVAVDTFGAQQLLESGTPAPALPQLLLQALVLRALDPALSYLENLLNGSIQLKQVRLDSSPPALPICLPLHITGLAQSCYWQLAMDECCAETLCALVADAAVGATRRGNDQYDYSALTVPAECLAGTTCLDAGTLAALAPLDVVLFDQTFYAQQRAIVRIAGKFDYLAEINRDATIILSHRVKQNMNEIPTENIQISGNQTGSEHESCDIDALPIVLTFSIGETQITFQELQRLTPGYLLDLGMDLSAPATIKANGKTIGNGRLVEIDKRLGVQINQLFMSTEKDQ